MIVGPDYVFISTRKAGTCSLYELLQEHFGGRRVGSFHAHTSSEIGDKSIFTTCRDPFSRMVSMWWYLTHRGDRSRFFDEMGFQEFCVLCSKRPRKEWLESQCDRHAKFNPSHVVHLEFLVPEFNKLPFVDKEVTFPRRNEAKDGCSWEGGIWDDKDPRLPPIERMGVPWETFYSDRTEAEIRNAYADDIERYYPWLTT